MMISAWLAALAISSPFQLVLVERSGVDQNVAEQIKERLTVAIAHARANAMPRAASPARDLDPDRAPLKLIVDGGPFRIMLQVTWPRTDGSTGGASAFLAGGTSEWSAPIEELARSIVRQMEPVGSGSSLIPERPDQAPAILTWTALGLALASGGVAIGLAGTAIPSAPSGPVLHSTEEHRATLVGSASAVSLGLVVLSAVSLSLAIILGSSGA